MFDPAPTEGGATIQVQYTILRERLDADGFNNHGIDRALAHVRHQQTRMPKRLHDYIDWRDDWRRCRAKKQLVQDLESGFIPLLATEMTAAEAQELRDVYREVEPKKFKRNFEALRKATRDAKDRAMRDAAGLARDVQRRSNRPASPSRRTRWDGSEAQVLLRQDMQQNLHLKRKELWQSRPEYYEHFTLRSFRDHIHTEDRRQKRLASRRQTAPPHDT
jgi:hypothetical protein